MRVCYGRAVGDATRRYATSRFVGICRLDWSRVQAGALFIVAKRIHVPAVFFGRARADAGGQWFGLRRHIKVERLGLGSRAAPFGNRLYPHDANLATLGEGQHVARADLGRRLGDFHRIYTHMAVADLPRRKRPGLEEPRVPEPAVEAVFCGCFAQVLSFRAAKTANGLSGSIFAVFSGRAV